MNQSQYLREIKTITSKSRLPRIGRILEYRQLGIRQHEHDKEMFIIYQYDSITDDYYPTWRIRTKTDLIYFIRDNCNTDKLEKV